MEKGMVIELENKKECAIADIVEKEGVEYLYLVNINDPKDLCFAVADDDKLVFVEDEELFDQLMYKVFEQNFS